MQLGEDRATDKRQMYLLVAKVPRLTDKLGGAMRVEVTYTRVNVDLPGVM